MKRFLTILALAAAGLFIAQKAAAIEDPDSKGTVHAAAHFSILPGIGGNLYGEFVFTNIWKGHLAGGLTAGYFRQRFSYSSDSSHMDDIYHNFIIAPRVTYGLNILEKLEVHAGVMAGVDIKKESWHDGSSHTHPRFCAAGIAGARYFVTSALALELELTPGYNTPYINLGIAFKF